MTHLSQYHHCSSHREGNSAIFDDAYSIITKISPILLIMELPKETKDTFQPTAALY